MFSLMACCFKWVKERREPRKEVCLILIGLDNAGKSTALNGVKGESLDLVAPTVGFAKGEFKFNKYDVTVYDLGGGKGIRGIWPSYYAEAHGIVFVIDASAEDRLQECRECLESTLKKDKVQGKRILLLANKQDQEGALDEIDICDQLDLEDIVNNSKCPCRVETCSAMQGIGKRMDPSIKEGMQWLLDGIASDWATITKRVEEDTKVQQEEEARSRKEKRERVMKEKEERKKREAAERKAAGLPDEDDEDEDMVGGSNPFAKVDNDYFAKKKQTDGESKAKTKKEKKKKEESKDDSTRDGTAMTELSDGSEKNLNKNSHKTSSREEAVIHANGGLGDKDSLSNGGRSLKEEGEESKEVIVGSRENLIDGEPSQTSATSDETKKKKKKKKVKKNKTAPMPVDGIDEVAPPPLQTPLGAPSWAQAPGHRSLFRSSQKPTLAPLVEQNSPRQNLDPLVPSSTANHKRKELPEIKTRALKPNIEDDDEVMT